MVHEARPKATSGLGTAGLVLGIVASLTAWVPILGLLAVPVAALGLLFAVLGVFASLLGAGPMRGCRLPRSPSAPRLSASRSSTSRPAAIGRAVPPRRRRRDWTRDLTLVEPAWRAQVFLIATRAG